MKRIIGISSILVKNSNLNSDFEGPRMVNNVLTATDKSIIYAIRRFASENNEKIFYERVENSEGIVGMLADRVLELGLKERTDFLKLWDVRTFGVTALKTTKEKGGKKGGDKELKSEVDKDNKKKKEDKNIDFSISGVSKVTYAENIWKQNDYTAHKILSQFSSEEGKYMSTLGEEYKVNFANYVAHIEINPNALRNDVFYRALMKEGKLTPEIEKLFEYSEADISKLKYYVSRGQTYQSGKSCAKSNALNGLTLFVELVENDLIPDIDIRPDQIELNNAYNSYNLSKVLDYLEKFDKYIKGVDIIYNSKCDMSNAGLDKVKNNLKYKIFTDGYVIE